MQNGIGTLENDLISFKTKQALTMLSTSSVFPKNVFSHKNQYRPFIEFIYNCENLGAIKIPLVNEKANKLQKLEYYQVVINWFKNRKSC